MRRQQRYQERQETCSDCVLIVRASKALKKRGLQPRMRAQCPLCNRKLFLAVTPSVLALDALYLEALRHYGTLLAKAKNLPVNLFNFKLEEEEIFADLPCGCHEDPNALCSEHPRMRVTFELKDLHGGEEGMFFVGRDGVLEDFDG
jgi:hypothetical protein